MDKIETMLELTTRQFKALRLTLVEVVDPAAISTVAKIPYKVLLARESLL